MDESVLERIKSIEEGLDVLKNLVRNMETLIDLALPRRLQKTMIVVQELGEATATEVSQKTQRARSVETIYLNQLAS